MPQDQAIGWLASLGPLALVVLMVLNRIGVPTWAAAVLVAAGGFAQRGVFDIFTTVLCAITGLIAGDVLAYSLGRQSVQRFLGRFEQRPLVQQARQTLAEHSRLAIFLSRFLFLFLAVPINFLASTMHVGRGRFMLMAASGNVVFVLVYVSVGYLFSGNWTALWQALWAQPYAVYIPAGLAGGAIALGIWGLRRQRSAAKPRRERS